MGGSSSVLTNSTTTKKVPTKAEDTFYYFEDESSKYHSGEQQKNVGRSSVRIKSQSDDKSVHTFVEKYGKTKNDPYVASSDSDGFAVHLNRCNSGDTVDKTPSETPIGVLSRRNSVKSVTFVDDNIPEEEEESPCLDHHQLSSNFQFEFVQKSVKEAASLFVNNSVARKAFIRFIKENPLKWLEPLAITAIINQNKSKGFSSASTPSSPMNRSTTASPVLNNRPANTNTSSSVSPRSAADSSASQCLSSTVLAFHSYNVTKPILYNNPHSTWSSESASSSQQLINNSNSAFSNAIGKSPAAIIPPITISSEQELEEKYRLDIVSLMKQLKIKDTYESNNLSASADSHDDQATVVTLGNNQKKSIEKVFSHETLSCYLFLILIPLFLSSPECQRMSSKNWKSDNEEEGSIASSSSTSNNKSSPSFVSEVKVANMIQLSKSIHKNESLSTIQSLLYQISKDLSSEKLESSLSSLDWLEKASSSLNSVPFGIAISRNLAIVGSQDHDDEAHGKEGERVGKEGLSVNLNTNSTPSFLKEPFPIVYTNSSFENISGYLEEEIKGKNLVSFLPKKDLKLLQFPKSHYRHSQNNPSTSYDYYNDRRLVQKFLDNNNRGGRCRLGLIYERKGIVTSPSSSSMASNPKNEKYYNFISTLPLYNDQKDYSYLLSFHYNIHNDSAKLSDFKIMEDLQCLFSMITFN
jgi:PAS domain-containing protein